MSTFAERIEAKASGEIEAIVIGVPGWGGEWAGGREIPDDKRGIVLSWDEARSLLDYEYGDGLGAPDCHAVYAWTSERVIFVSKYDGSTTITSVPRAPQDTMPHMPGGG